VVRKTNRRNGREPEDAWAAALRLLARRDYGSDELRRRLLDQGFPAEAVEAAIARGSELGYLDDARHVERLSRAFVATGRAVGPRLAQELRRRGLPENLIRAALAESGAAGEEEALHSLIARRFPAFDYAAADDRERRRVILFLQRRGFPLDRILNELKRTDP